MNTTHKSQKEDNIVEDKLIPLDRLGLKRRGTVRKVQGKGEVHQRLLDMGLVPGAPVQVERIAPLGDPVEVEVRGYHLSLRRREAADILVSVN